MSKRILPLVVPFFALCACAPDPVTKSEVASYFLASLADQDVSALERFAAPDLTVDYSKTASSLDELLEYIEKEECAAHKEFELKIADSEIVPGTRPYRGFLECDLGGPYPGIMNVELTIDMMQVSKVDWYFLTIAVPN